MIRARNLVRFSETSFANALGLDATVPIEIDDTLTYEPVAIDPAQVAGGSAREPARAPASPGPAGRGARPAVAAPARGISPTSR